MLWLAVSAAPILEFLADEGLNDIRIKTTGRSGSFHPAWYTR